MKSRYICAGLAALGVLVAGGSVSRADDERPRGKGKDSSSGKVEVDLGKLPPDLAKQLQKYLGGKKEGTGKGKTAAAKSKPARTSLPPGLAMKSKDHPGVKAFLARSAKETAPARRATADLPPGLRNKPADHPGVTAYLESQKQGAKPEEKPAAKSKKKSRKDD